MKSYYIYTYGCQMNTADSERLSHQLESVGYTPTEDVETADLILLNTCAVRENAETKVYGRIGELMSLHSNSYTLTILRFVSIIFLTFMDIRSIDMPVIYSISLRTDFCTCCINDLTG